MGTRCGEVLGQGRVAEGFDADADLGRGLWGGTEVLAEHLEDAQLATLLLRAYVLEPAHPHCGHRPMGQVHPGGDLDASSGRKPALEPSLLLPHDLAIAEPLLPVRAPDWTGPAP